jgi:hypothetical protein
MLETRNPYLSQYMARGNCHDKKPMAACLHLKDSLFLFHSNDIHNLPLHKFPSEISSMNLILSISIGSFQKYSYLLGIAPWTLLREFTPSC